ncbi:MAG: hypothetical protein D9N11_03030 [Ketobacter sp.]|nr:MAG: hypothetical protein D9N11_03030 [Ketobacter sp.]
MTQATSLMRSLVVLLALVAFNSYAAPCRPGRRAAGVLHLRPEQGKLTIVRLPELEFLNDKAGKPICF